MISGPSVGYEYDNLNRIISRNYFGNIAEQIVYEDGSNRVQSFTVGGNTYYYTYDDNGNITSISDDDGFVDYTYDSQNQLIREDNNWAGKTFVWTYDTAGNITSEKEYAYTLGVLGTPISTKNYTYGNATWGDLLTGYNGKTITYDEIGNPRNDGTWQYTWVQGRQLVEMAKTGEKWEFTYNTDGLRTQRKRGTLIYNYVYTDGQLRQMTCGTNKLVFAYGVDGRPYALQYNGTYYYYLLNLQGDVIGIANTSGTQVVSYTYDAWGDLLSVSGSEAATLGAMNPLRYRGYVYDTETGLYYLKSRYYNAEIGRFISPDNYPSTGQDFSGNNMFAYCGNNPVARADEEGEFWNVIIGAIVGAVVNAVTTAIDTYESSGSVDWGEVLISATTGAISGGVAATGFGVFTQAAVSAGASAVGSIASDWYNRSKNPSAENVSLRELGGISLRAVASAAVGFGSSIFGTAAGKITSGRLEEKGADMIFRGKIGAGCWTKAQARNMVNQGKTIVNTARGISSVVGTMFTWPTSTVLYLGISGR